MGRLIRIYHAFNGFLYAPLFLADRLKLFPEPYELIYTKGDIESINELVSFRNKPDAIGFAICDPFSEGVAEAVLPSPERLCVVGSLITKLPVWVYNTDPRLATVGREEDMSRYGEEINCIVTYPRGTTGFRVGERVRRMLGRDDLQLTTRDFGAEFQGSPDPKTVIVTSDVLRIIPFIDNISTKHHILFDYARGHIPDVSPYLFTGIVALRSTVEDRLIVVLRVLDALRESIELMREVSHKETKPLKSKVIDNLRAKFANEMNSTNLTNSFQQESRIRDLLRYVDRVALYDPAFPRLDNPTWEKAWSNAESLWAKGDPSRISEHEGKDEEIPGLLFKEQWRPRLERYFACRLTWLDTEVKSSNPAPIVPNPATVGPPNLGSTLQAAQGTRAAIFEKFEIFLSAASFLAAVALTAMALSTPRPDFMSKFDKTYLIIRIAIMDCVTFFMLMFLILLIIDRRTNHSNLSDLYGIIGFWIGSFLAFVTIIYTFFQ